VNRRYSRSAISIGGISRRPRHHIFVWLHETCVVENEDGRSEGGVPRGGCPRNETHDVEAHTRTLHP
jgi:hypothetical protein